MGRELKRVALDFKWPLQKVYVGFLNPYYKFMHDCKVCGGKGMSKRGIELENLWYGYAEFTPEMTGSTPHTIDNPYIRKLATRNAYFQQYCWYLDFEREQEFIKNNPHLKASESHIKREADRLCNECYNNHWSHHLSQEDIDILWDANVLQRDFKDGTKPTQKEVNERSVSDCDMGGSYLWTLIKEKCKREGVEAECEHCKGEGHIWEYKEYEEKADKWKQVEPPNGEGYQIWETVSEGSPMSPVFEKPEDLANWMIKNDTSITKNSTFEDWMRFITETQWAPSLILENGVVKNGVEA